MYNGIQMIPLKDLALDLHILMLQVKLNLEIAQFRRGRTIQIHLADWWGGGGPWSVLKIYIP